MKFLKHFYTITSHKYLVLKGCFRVGLYWQGITHDLSKYSPTEFYIGSRYYQGSRSPNNAEREKKGYSSAWLHHKGRNKHHYEYWIDYSLEKDHRMTGMRMPNKYIVEMFMDRIAAGKTYKKDAYSDSSPLEYYSKGKGCQIMHHEVEEILEELLTMLSKKGEKETFQYIKKNLL